MTQADIDNGRFIMLIDIAPVMLAEFVISGSASTLAEAPVSLKVNNINNGGKIYGSRHTN